MSDQEPDLNDVFRVAFERLQPSIRTAVPATVVSFSRGPRECSVSIDMLGVLRTGEAVALPQVDRVPVLWPAGGGWAMDADLTVGESVLLIVFDRDISGWLPAGAAKAPVRRMLHDVSSCVAIPGLHPIARQGRQSVAPGELFIGADSGSPPMLTMRKLPASATLEATTISLGEAATLGAARVTDPVAASAGMIVWMTAIGAFCSSIAGLPDGTPLVATAPLKALFAAVPSAQATAQALTANILSGSTKTRIE